MQPRLVFFLTQKGRVGENFEDGAKSFVIFPPVHYMYWKTNRKRCALSDFFTTYLHFFAQVNGLCRGSVRKHIHSSNLRGCTRIKIVLIFTLSLRPSKLFVPRFVSLALMYGTQTDRFLFSASKLFAIISTS